MQIQAKDLKKVYKDGVAAVNKNSFQVKKGEVFGLLGPNGAGKSTMFNILTLDLQRTEGSVRILNEDLDNVRVDDGVLGTKLGMCPQFNPIQDRVSVDQSLEFICEVKGVPISEVQF